MKYALAQINTRVGDVERNVASIKQACQRAVDGDADVVVFPELTVTGYPPNDMLEHASMIREAIDGIKEITRFTEDVPIQALVGFVDVNRELFGKPLYNAMALIHAGEIHDIFYKTLLPSYDVFDECRYFKANDLSRAGHFAPSVSVGLKDAQAAGAEPTVFAPTLCEDLWHDTKHNGYYLYQINPIEPLMLQDPDVIISMSASPYAFRRETTRLELAARTATRYGRPVLYTNLVGMNEGLLFDGASFVMGANGRVLERAARFEEDLVFWEPNPRRRGSKRLAEELDPCESRYRALVMGIRDFFDKAAIPKKAVIGLSGGVDSALVLALTVEAIGAENVIAATMPSQYSSRGSVVDSRTLARRLGVTLHKLPISSTVRVLERTLAPLFEGLDADVTEENIQARVRGTLLMALANKFGGTVLNTGNKSELAVGYCTMYGDMIGGLAPIGDLYKTEVYDLCKWYNRRGPRTRRIPEAILMKAPSAELRPEQRDDDDLPAYDILDAILEQYLERKLEAEEIARREQQDLKLVRRVIDLVARNEHKRNQAPPVLRVHERAFGTGWRYPVMGRFPR